MSEKIDRRGFVTGAALGALAGTQPYASAQQLPEISAEDISRIHSEEVKLARSQIDQTLAFYENPDEVPYPGVQDLVDAGLISDSAAYRINEVFAAVLSSNPVEEILQICGDAVSSLREEGEEIAAAIVEIAIDSIKSVNEFFQDVDWKRAAKLVIADAAGAVRGARWTAKWFKHPAAIIAAGIAGGVAGSVLAEEDFALELKISLS